MEVATFSHDKLSISEVSSLACSGILWNNAVKVGIRYKDIVIIVTYYYQYHYYFYYYNNVLLNDTLLMCANIQVWY